MAELYGNLDDLLAQVRLRAEQRALAVEVSTDEQVREVREEGLKRATAAAEEVATKGKEACAVVRREVLAAAEARMLRRSLDAREARLERVWQAAEAEVARRLAADASAPLPPALAQRYAELARDAAGRLGGDEVLVRLDARALASLPAADVEAWTMLDGPSIALDPAPLEAGHGVVARAGRASVDATFEARLRQAKERLRGEVAALLAGRSPAGGDAP